jgi:hypothetical protein
MKITQQEFEQLSREEQNLRWALFLKSNGYTKNLMKQQIDNLTEKFLVKKEPIPKSWFEGR